MVHFVGFVLQYVLILCNTIGTPLDSKYIDIGENFSSFDDTPACIFLKCAHPKSARHTVCTLKRKLQSVLGVQR